jgi:aromatic ring-opening dioxygenase catalytic subunit (LigB family)
MAGCRALPSLYISHGAGPCFFIANPLGGPGTWDGLRRSLEHIPDLLPCQPKAILVVSAHWETSGFRVTRGTAPPLVYDYFNYPPEAYTITYPAPGNPALGERVIALLQGAGLRAADDARGYDHAVFIPMKVAFPQADIPIVALSLDASLDPALHLRAGEALAPLRDEGVLIVGSGSSFHNRSADPAGAAAFDRWLSATIVDPAPRREGLIDWANAPGARVSHAREEHLLPLMVAAGAAADAHGHLIFRDLILGTPMSGFAFGEIAGAS